MKTVRSDVMSVIYSSNFTRSILVEWMFYGNKYWMF